MSSWVLSSVTSQLPGLIEKYEPNIESSLRSALLKIKKTNPDQANLFYINWKKLNGAVEQTLGPAAAAAAGGKRTRRNRRKQRK